MVRMAKRELATEIERLGRRGQWVEVLGRERQARRPTGKQAKENSSLYGNVKPVSIRQAFLNSASSKGHSCLKPTNSQRVSRFATVNLLTAAEVWPVDELPTPKGLNPFDSTELPPFSDFYALLEARYPSAEELTLASSQPTQPPKDTFKSQKMALMKKAVPQSADIVNGQRCPLPLRESKSSYRDLEALE
jgi:hypothetical protein